MKDRAVPTETTGCKLPVCILQRIMEAAFIYVNRNQGNNSNGGAKVHKYLLL